MAVKLFQSQTSMFCEKVRVVFAMKKVPYEIVDVRKDDRKSLIEYTGQRKVPSLDYNGQCVIDSTIISSVASQLHPNIQAFGISVPGWEKDEEVAALQAKAKGAAAATQGGSFGIGRGGLTPMSGLAWLAVGVPILWGVWITLSKSLVLFR